MAVLGEGRAITRQHIEKLAKTHGISPKRVVAVIDDVRATLADWPSHARDTGVGVSMVSTGAQN